MKIKLCKHTYTSRYFQFTSYLPKIRNTSVVKILMRRAGTHCSSELEERKKNKKNTIYSGSSPRTATQTLLFGKHFASKNTTTQAEKSSNRPLPINITTEIHHSPLSLAPAKRSPVSEREWRKGLGRSKLETANGAARATSKRSHMFEKPPTY